jgi:hypothetical protein
MLHTKDNVLGTLYAYLLLYIFSFTIADGARDRSNSSGDETEIKPGRIRYNLRKRSLDSSSESVSGDVGDQKDTRKRRRSCVCFVDHCCPFGHCVVCPSSIYGF